MTFKEKHPVRYKINIYNKSNEHAIHFNYLGYNIYIDDNRDLQRKISKFNHVLENRFVK
jgi:hypothetical protein